MDLVVIPGCGDEPGGGGGVDRLNGLPRVPGDLRKEDLEIAGRHVRPRGSSGQRRRDDAERALRARKGWLLPPRSFMRGMSVTDERHDGERATYVCRRDLVFTETHGVAPMSDLAQTSLSMFESRLVE